jgi:hypothetical protein
MNCPFIVAGLVAPRGGEGQQSRNGTEPLALFQFRKFGFPLR